MFLFQQRNAISSASNNAAGPFLLAREDKKMDYGAKSTIVLSDIKLPPYQPQKQLQQQQQQQHQHQQMQQSQHQPTYFQAKYPFGLNASPESAISPSISSVATSASEVCTQYMYQFFISLKIDIRSEFRNH